VAYSWRSQFLTSNIDCCIGLPVWQRAAGFLDASLHYKITDHVEAELDGKNLLDTTTVFAQQVQGDSPQTPGARPILLNSAWVRSDRAIKFGVRWKF
jgi:outer membrane receptor protein involved in Fe transport